MTNLFDFVIVARGRVGNSVTQRMMDGCDGIFMPPFSTLDLTKDAEAVLALMPGNPGASMKAWPWVQKTGLLVHNPRPWVNRMEEVLPHVTTRDLLIQLVREPREHAAALFVHTVRTRASEIIVGNAPSPSTWMNEISDPEKFFEQFGKIFRYQTLTADLSPQFRRHLVIDFQDLLPERVERTIPLLFEAVGIPHRGDPGPLKAIERSVARTYMLYSKRTVDIYGYPLDLLINYAGAVDPYLTGFFDHDLARIDAAEVIAGRDLVLDFEPKPFAWQVNASRYFAIPRAVRERLERSGALREMFRTVLQQWLDKSDHAERTTRMIVKRTDLARVSDRALELAGEDIDLFLKDRPELRAAWKL